SLSRAASRARAWHASSVAMVSPSPVRTRPRALITQSRASALAQLPPPSSCACAPSLDTPKPARFRPCACTPQSCALVRAPSLSACSRASSPLARLLPTFDAPALFSRSPARPRVPSTPVSRSPIARPCTPAVPRVSPTPAACLPPAHDRASLASNISALRLCLTPRPFDLLRASPHDARHTPDNRFSSIPLSLDSIGSPDGHGSQPSNPMQSPARHIQPSSIPRLPLLRNSECHSRFFLVHGPQHWLAFCAFVLRRLLIRHFLAFNS
ncbi:Unknown protein, partial [Striga hermonthica]